MKAPKKKKVQKLAEGGVPADNIDPNTGLPVEKPRMTGAQANAIAQGVNLVGQTALNATPTTEKNVMAKDIGQDALKYGAAGAQIGSVFGPTGTLVGAGIGAIGGGIEGAIRGKQDKNAMGIAKEAENQANMAAKVGSAYKKGGEIFEHDMFGNPVDKDLQGLAKGGLTKEKARQILHEGVANGKKLTDRQRRYMGYMSEHGMEAGGGVGGAPMLNLGPPEGQKPKKGQLMADGGTPLVAKQGDKDVPVNLISSNEDVIKSAEDTKKFYTGKGYKPIPNSTITPEEFSKKGDFTKYLNPDAPGLAASLSKPKKVDTYVAPSNIIDPTTGKYTNQRDKVYIPTYTPEKTYEVNLTVPVPEKADFSQTYGKKKGGEIKGPGGPTEDKIPMKAPEGSFIVPAKNAKQAEELRSKYLEPSGKAKGGKTGVKIKVSNGEHMFTPEEVKILQSKGIDLNKLAPESDSPIQNKKDGGMIKDATQNKSKGGLSSKIKKGAEHEKEHEETLKQVAKGDISIKEATRETAKDHLKENPEYYEKLDEAGLKKGGGIHIKKSKEGTLHTALGVPKDEKIPNDKLEINENDSPALKKKKQFAINAKKFDHKFDGGIVASLAKGGRATRIPSDAIDNTGGNDNIENPDYEARLKSLASDIQKMQKQGSKQLPFVIGQYNRLKKEADDYAKSVGKKVYSNPEEADIIQKATASVRPATTNKPATPRTANAITVPTKAPVKMQDEASTGLAESLSKGVRADADQKFQEAQAAKQPKETADAVKVTDQPETKTSSDTQTPTFGGTATTERPEKYQGSKIDKALELGQIGLGLAGTLANKRPKYTIPREVTEAYQQAKQDATYGLDPTTKAAIENEIKLRTNTSAGLVAGTAGGNAAQAFAEIQAVNAAGGRGLIDMYARDAAAKQEKKQAVYGLAGQLGNYRNFAYQQDMNKFIQNQQASANLLNAGISNLTGSFQLDKANEQQGLRDRLIYGNSNPFSSTKKIVDRKNKTGGPYDDAEFPTDEWVRTH